MPTAVLDSACGMPALTLMPEEAAVLTVEFKVNLLAPAAGERFLARGRVVRAGRTLTVCRGDASLCRGRRTAHRDDDRHDDVGRAAERARGLASAQAGLPSRFGTRVCRACGTRSREGRWGPSGRKSHLATTRRGRHADLIDEAIITRDEVIALLFNVSDIVALLAHIDRLLEADGGEEEDEG